MKGKNCFKCPNSYTHKKNLKPGLFLDQSPNVCVCAAPANSLVVKCFTADKGSLIFAAVQVSRGEGGGSVDVKADS